MKKQSLLALGCSFILILAFSAACSSNRSAVSSNRLASEEPVGEHPQLNKRTKITKDVLRERLNGKNVDFIETSPCDKSASDKVADMPEPVIKTAEPFPCGKPNPLTLNTTIIKNYKDSLKVKLNGEDYDFDGLVSRLNSIFKEREANGVYREGTNIVEKRINLSATADNIPYYEQNDITVEDFEKLINDLHQKGFEEISIDFVGFPSQTISSSSTSAGSVPKTLSGGVLNEKAVNLVQPSYPAAAKAVKASGAVNVQITVDEQGNVTSAEAVSGHPLLRAASVQAARSSKFAVTKIGGQPAKVTGIIVYKFTSPE